MFWLFLKPMNSGFLEMEPRHLYIHIFLNFFFIYLLGDFQRLLAVVHGLIKPAYLSMKV